MLTVPLEEADEPTTLYITDGVERAISTSGLRTGMADGGEKPCVCVCVCVCEGKGLGGGWEGWYLWREREPHCYPMETI